jgi:hypothetical protein
MQTQQTATATADAGTATTTPPRIGQPWPAQGGIYLGICRGDAGQPDQHLIVVTTDPAATFKSVWGEYGQDVAGAKSRFDGRANTIAMAAAGSEAAKRVLALQVNGVADCFMPSQSQLQLACANAPEAFERDYHWSSTQDSQYSVFAHDFEIWCRVCKDDQHRVRAFRAISP